MFFNPNKLTLKTSEVSESNKYIMILGHMSKEVNKLIAVIKLNKIRFDLQEACKLFDCIKEKTTPQNVATYYQFCELFKLSSISKVLIKYIERWFTTVVETNNFLALDFHSAEKILTSSNLDISSEVQVFSAANDWTNCNLKERKIHAKDLLLTVRLPLLSDYIVKHVLQNESVFYKVEESLAVINKVLKEKDIFFQDLSSRYFTSRYCSLNEFSILYFADIEPDYKPENYVDIESDYEPDTEDEVDHIVSADGYIGKRDFFQLMDGKNLKSLKSLPSLDDHRNFDNFRSPIIYLKGNIYLFNCLNTQSGHSNQVKKYSIATDSIEVVADMSDDRDMFCVCGFMDKVYFIGGCLHETELDICTQFDTKDYTWRDVASMNEIRSYAACTVFEGRVVVSGGYGINGILNSVEAYDHMAAEWSYMPNMVKKRGTHSLVAVRNKLFAIGGYVDTCETFDYTCDRFVLLKPTIPTRIADVKQAISIGDKIVFFGGSRTTVLSYDVVKNMWTNEPCNAVSNYNLYTTIPQLEVQKMI